MNWLWSIHNQWIREKKNDRYYMNTNLTKYNNVYTVCDI